MIFVDTNVFMYAVGGEHELQTLAREFFFEANRSNTALCTSAEVLQELMHAYLPASKFQGLSDSMSLVSSCGVVVWPLEEEDVTLARQLMDQHPNLQARDLCHLASCRRRGVTQVKTFDQTLHGVIRMKSSEQE